MRRPAWHRFAARIVLVTFTTCFVACGGSGGEAPSTTTVPAVQPATTSPPPPTVPPPTMPPAPPPAPPPTLPAQPPDQLGKDELRQLVAPVALYPDVVLASLLPATTNPEQIHDAAQYVGQAQHVDRIPDDRDWDGSIIGLLQFPDVLRWLDDNPAWTDEMGHAVTYQQADVLDAIQDYRRLAQNAGNLKSNEYQTVRYVRDQDIRIEPARPDVVYVPSYDPALATQPQPVSPGINPWIVFGAGAAVGALGAWALYSIFDDDDDDHHHYYGGRRGIRRYDNYYYARGRRPRTVDWAPRQRAYRRQAGWQQPQRMQHRAPAGSPVRAAPLRAPSAARPGEVRRELRQERREQKQETRQERRGQRQEHRQERQMQQQEKRQERRDQRGQRQEQRRDQREQRQTDRQQQRQERQEQRQQRQEPRREQRQQRQEQRQENRQERQGQRQQRQGQRQEMRQERQEHRQGQRQERQERRQQNQAERNNKKKKQQQQQ